jgi:hypothetical protein
MAGAPQPVRDCGAPGRKKRCDQTGVTRMPGSTSDTFTRPAAAAIRPAEAGAEQRKQGAVVTGVDP